MRGALTVVGVLGVVVVFAIGLVTLVVMRGSSNGTAASHVTRAWPGTTASAKTSPSSHKATASPKPKAKASPKPKASPKKTAAASRATPPATLLTVPAGWKLAFDPALSGTQLDTGTWATCYDWVANPSVGCDNNPTAEKEWYLPSQVNVSGGTLNLVAGLLFLIVVIILMAAPAHFLLGVHGAWDGPGPLWLWALVGSGVIFGGLAVALPLRAGARNLRAMEF